MTALSGYVLGPTGFTKARRPREAEELRAIADKASPKLKKAILAALQAGDTAALSALADAINAGDTGRVLALLGLADLETRFAPVQAELRAVLAEAGAAASAKIPAVRKPIGPDLTFTFDLTNPRTISAVQQYDMRLIREISDNTRDGVRALVRDGIEKGVNPRTTARLIRQQVGLTERQNRFVGNFRRELETFHTRKAANGWNLGGTKSKAPGGAGVLAIDADGNPVDGITQRRLRDFRFDGTLKRAMESGKPLTPEQIDKMVGRYRDRLLAYRADNIAKTESLRATNQGAHLAWQQAVDTGAVDPNEVRRFWSTAGDERVRLSHRSIPKTNSEGVGMDEPFITPNGQVMYPPLGVNCRCVVVYRIIT